MNVEVRYRLTGGCTVVDADVVAGGMELVVEIVTGRDQERHQVGAFCVRDFEERRHVPLRDDQRVAGRDREAVANGDCVFGVLVTRDLRAVSRRGRVDSMQHRRQPRSLKSSRPSKAFRTGGECAGTVWRWCG